MENIHTLVIFIYNGLQFGTSAPPDDGVWATRTKNDNARHDD